MLRLIVTICCRLSFTSSTATATTTTTAATITIFVVVFCPVFVLFLLCIHAVQFQPVRYVRKVFNLWRCRTLRGCLRYRAALASSVLCFEKEV